MRILQIVWWIAVFLVLAFTLGAGVSETISGHSPNVGSAFVLILAMAAALWAIGKRLFDIVTIERLSD